MLMCKEIRPENSTVWEEKIITPIRREIGQESPC